MGRLTDRHQRRARLGQTFAAPLNNKVSVAALALGIAALLSVGGWSFGWLPGALGVVFALPLAAGAFLVGRERRAGVYLLYATAAAVSLLALGVFAFTRSFVAGMILGFAVWILVRQTVKFDEFLDERKAEDAPPRP